MLSRRLFVSLGTALIIALGATWGTLVCPSALYAADGDPQVYVLDMERIVKESIVGKAAKSNLEEEVRKTEGKLVLQRSELERMQADLEKQSSLLAAAAMDEKREAVARKTRDFERAMQDRKEEISRMQAAEMKKVVSEIDEAVKEVSSRGAFPIIIEKDPRLVVFAADRVDLTNQVIAAMDARKISR